jgi:hypothetical protein
LKFIDLTGSVLNYAGNKRIRDGERDTMGLPDERFYYGILPSRYMLQKVEKAVEKIIPLNCFETKSGEGFRFTGVPKKGIVIQGTRPA